MMGRYNHAVQLRFGLARKDKEVTCCIRTRGSRKTDDEAGGVQPRSSDNAHCLFGRPGGGTQGLVGEWHGMASTMEGNPTGLQL
jgi:hypothetical protein